MAAFERGDDRGNPHGEKRQNGPIPPRAGASSFWGGFPPAKGNTFMAYSKFNCVGCGKLREVTGSKYVFTLGRRARICEECKLVRLRQQQREAKNGTNG